MARRFAPLPPVPDHPALELAVLERWDAERTFDRLREQNQGGPRSVSYTHLTLPTIYSV